MTTKDQDLEASDRASMLSAIDMKIARTHVWNESTGYFLPVMIGDVLDWWDTYETHEENYPVWFNTIIEMVGLWKTKRESLDKQSTDCIAYVHSLLNL